MKDEIIVAGATGVAAALSPVGKELVQQVCNAVGAILSPWHIRRVKRAEAEADAERIILIANAEADAALIHATNEDELAQLKRRTEMRVLAEQMQQQLNMEAVLTKAVDLLNSEAKPHEMPKDWIVNFFGKVRGVSDGEMQDLWAKLLAGEANEPGSFSKQSVNLLADLDPEDAKFFTKMCGFGWDLNGFKLTILSQGIEPFESGGMTFNALYRMVGIGFIHYAWDTHFNISLPSSPFVTNYFGRPLTLIAKKDSYKGRLSVHVGRAKLTRAGEQLARICGAEPVDGFYEYMRERWRSEGQLEDSEAA